MNGDRDNYPILHGGRITNTREFKDALVAASADLLTGRISPKEANAINREAKVILKMTMSAFDPKRTCGFERLLDGLASQSREARAVISWNS